MASSQYDTHMDAIELQNQLTSILMDKSAG